MQNYDDLLQQEIEQSYFIQNCFND